ncbi:MAG: M48 family metallopeptidase [Hyphomicrobiaceae bacterium]|nr:M48 family metallopeptidase [Hyphomicrobiaceae bacterium]
MRLNSKFLKASGLAATVALAVTIAPALAPIVIAQDGGVKVSGKSIFRKVVSAETIEQQAGLQYEQMTRQAFQKRALLDANHPQVIRLRKIARDLLPHANRFNERAKDWKWEVNLLNSPQINAFCMPGGKIAFFAGILEKLQLTDDEVAMVMGHEIGHALWEHARERAGKGMALNAGRVLAGLVFGQLGDLVGAGAGSLANLKFSRNDETEADLIGMELAARAGYDPRSGITLWEKMSKANKGAPPQWLSTHPSGATRIDTIQKHLPEVMPLFEKAKTTRG